MPGTHAARLSARCAAAVGAGATRPIGEVVRLRRAALRAAGAAAAARGAQHRAAGGLGRARRRDRSARRSRPAAQACRPLIARDGLGRALIEPALRFLGERNAAVRLRTSAARLRLRRRRGSRRSISASDSVALGDGRRGDPGGAARTRRRRWCPASTAPTEFRAIVNAHFRIEPPPDLPPILGAGQRHDRVDVRLSGPAVGHHQRRPTACSTRRARSWRETIWQRGRDGRPGLPPDAAAVADRARAARDLRGDAGAECPAARRRHAIGAICSSPAIGPHTGLPATIEGAIRSGQPRRRSRLRNADDAGRMTDADAPPAARSRIGATASRRRPRALLDRQQPDGHWVFELEADATIPAEYVLLRHYLGEPVDAELEAKIARLSAPHPGRARRLAAVPRRRLRHEREREGLFRAQDDRRLDRRRRTCARAREAILRARRRRARQRVHARCCSRCSASSPGARCR